jgi:hypothetical protein
MDAKLQERLVRAVCLIAESVAAHVGGVKMLAAKFGEVVARSDYYRAQTGLTNVKLEMKKMELAATKKFRGET